MKAILLIDHGSVRPEANAMLECMGSLLQTMLGPSVIVRYAHMELAEPTIADGVAACIEAGAAEIVAFPYMLSPGKHSTRDIPRMVAEAARAHSGVRVSVTPAFGIDERLAEVIADRAGAEIVRSGRDAQMKHCLNPRGATGACGEACCVAPSARPATRGSAAARS